MKTALRTRFETFIPTLDGVEKIDQLKVGRDVGGVEKADYFAEKRKLVMELKTLETDTEWKIARILEPHREREEFPVFFGEWEVAKVLKHLPDGAEINKRIFNAITTSIRAIFRKATGQIAHTKKSFSLHKSQGLLVILNETLEVLSPEAILSTLLKIAAGKLDDGRLRYTEINAILLITEEHVKEISKGVLAHPSLLLKLEFHQPFVHEGFVGLLREKWAAFNNALMLNDSQERHSFKNLGFDRVSAYEKANRKEMPRYEAWAKYYRWNPYLRKFSDEWLRWLFGIIMVEVGKGMTKRGTAEQASRAKYFWMEVFTHFMEEVRHRAIDIRFFTKNKDAFRELDDEMRKRFPEDFEIPL